MEQYTNLLSETDAKKSKKASLPQSGATMIEQLLSAFNNNPRNSKVVEYIFRQNLFDMIGKSRHEMVHSTTLMHFLDIVVMRAKE